MSHSASTRSSVLDHIKGPITSQEPAFRLIRETAKKEWKLVLLNLGSNILGAFSEGATLGVIYLAVEVLSSQSKGNFNWSNIPVINSSTVITGWLSELPPTGLFISLLVLAVVLQGLQGLTRFLNQLSVGYFSARCRVIVTTLIHRQILKLSFACASSYKVGDFTDYAAQGPIAIRTEIEETSSLMVGSLLSITYLAVLVRISPILLVAVVIMGFLITFLQKKLLPKIRTGSRNVSRSEVEISKRIIEDFQGLRLLHTSGQLGEAENKLKTGMGELEILLRNQVRRMAVVGPISSLMPILAIAIIAALSLLLLGNENNSILPSLVTFVVGLQKVGGRMNIITVNLNQLANNSGRFQRLNEILREDDKEFRRAGGERFKKLEDSIKFESVSLRYGPEMPMVLKDISFCLSKGKTLALVGASGAGKSSIADLMVGLYSPTSGCIRVDNNQIEDLDISTWQQNIGVVSQDTFLFNATIAENIAFGTPGKKREEIIDACVSAQAAGFIEGLPDGYDTVVGERGYRLSGGQRQRLSLARAILKNPELLILDEATSALDSKSELLVQQAIERFEKNHTVLVIAHRLSTVVGADNIIVLDGGEIVETGNHNVLMERQGVYWSMWMRQSFKWQEPSVEPA